MLLAMEGRGDRMEWIDLVTGEVELPALRHMPLVHGSGLPYDHFQSDLYERTVVFPDIQIETVDLFEVAVENY